ncbi:hypothetical protein NOCA1190143 [metagenome]|uniref:Uncharacterized protein n=1 Tax=metagenome TaxID=256318 RepID=A0A2P2CD45_9ZZZZ
MTATSARRVAAFGSGASLHRAPHARGEQFPDRIPIVSGVLQVVRGVAGPEPPQGYEFHPLGYSRETPGRSTVSDDSGTDADAVGHWKPAAVVLTACGGGGEDEMPVGRRSSWPPTLGACRSPTRRTRPPTSRPLPGGVASWRWPSTG